MIKLFKKGTKTIVVVHDEWTKLYNQTEMIISRSFHKIDKYLRHTEEIIEGRGISQPCGEDVYDENIGKQIAFKKAKLHANMKKFNRIYNVYKILTKTSEKIVELLIKLNTLIEKDIDYIKQYNKDFKV